MRALFLFEYSISACKARKVGSVQLHSKCQKGNGKGLGTAQDIFTEITSKATARQCSAREGTGSPGREHLLFLLTIRSMDVAFLSLAQVNTTAPHPSPQEEDTANRLYFHPILSEDTFPPPHTVDLS